MKAWIGAAALIGLMVSGSAAMADGNELLTQCQASLRSMEIAPNSAPDFNAGFCFGTVAAVMNTMTNLYYDLPKEARACFPVNGIQYTQAVRIVTRYMSEHPASLHKSGALLSIEAFRSAFPCNK
ncbi:Rap1a/Tai family immunity protein [Pseudomonas sp. MPC6]|uniref:Rap1a/Tai family immunity protein n=1 Tax=unclassified Pseudomonas TaxID=196821 RepID=UPI0011104C0E|nr:Rap1a/Tai family immunity protein [Pseudomonas sp. MPC6]QCY09848.1 hypothetical protein ELQ88_03070 [Pseudomonas sp. MPC6]